MTVTELLSEMPPSELVEWSALYLLEHQEEQAEQMKRDMEKWIASCG